MSLFVWNITSIAPPSYSTLYVASTRQVAATLRPIKHMAVGNKYEAQCETSRMLCMLSKRAEIHSYISKSGIVTALVRELLNTRYLNGYCVTEIRITHTFSNRHANWISLWYCTLHNVDTATGRGNTPCSHWQPSLSRNPAGYLLTYTPNFLCCSSYMRTFYIACSSQRANFIAPLSTVRSLW